MPERSFGRTVRYRRTKLGLSQAKLGDLVGRSPATIRSWEADKSTPNDPKVLATLSAILGVDERTVFGKAGVEPPIIEETSPTIEQALASLAPEAAEEPEGHPTTPDRPAEDEDHHGGDVEAQTPSAFFTVPGSVPLAPVAPQAPVELAPTLPLASETQVGTLTLQPVGEASYIEDRFQKQMYLVRTLATVVALVALVIALFWAVGEGLSALGEWWEGFFGTLRL